MSSVLSYPGVYLEEVPSGVRTITGVATSITAFVGRSRRGLVNIPVRVQSFAEFTQIFGDLWQPSTLGYAVRHFFQHGGSDALIVRVFTGDITDSTATVSLPTATGKLELAAAGPGAWGNRLRATVDDQTNNLSDPLLFNLLIEELEGTTTVAASEMFRNVSVDPLSPRFINSVLRDTSALVRVKTSAPKERPTNTNRKVFAAVQQDPDGQDITDADLLGSQQNRTGMYALDAADLFNLLCLPPLTRTAGLANATWATAAKYCRDRRAMLIIDTAWTDPTTAVAGVNALRAALGDDKGHAAAYFPNLRMPDPLAENRLAEFAPCGAVAGIIARTDVQRGVWKAPAGQEAAFSGVQGFSYTLTDLQNGLLNPLGLNCLRSFPVTGNLVWGARTMAGADQLASEWKYIPIRRLALFIEESLFRGTQWVVFEPNDEPLWAQIRLNVGAFMQDLFRQGAFQGTTPREAYFVKCDQEINRQSDINRGVVNIYVGFAPLKPAEFVVIKLQQIPGQIAV